MTTTQPRPDDALARDVSPFARSMGFRILSANADELVAELPVRPDFANHNGVMHGGALMGFADSLGGALTFLNIPAERSTTTVESKTNFLRPIRLGEVAVGRCTPLHRGRTTLVMQTVVSRGDGQVAAIVTQTQIVLDWNPRPQLHCS